MINNRVPSRVLPLGPWLTWLERDDYVWLTKERIPAIVCFAYQPPRPGHAAGQLMLRKLVDNRLAPAEVWYVTPDGFGFDGNRLMCPCEGHLEAPAPNPLCRVIGDRLIFDSLLHRVRELEKWRTSQERPERTRAIDLGGSPTPEVLMDTGGHG